MLKSVSPKVLTDRISLRLTECRNNFYSFYCSDLRTFFAITENDRQVSNFSTSLGKLLANFGKGQGLLWSIL